MSMPPQAAMQGSRALRGEAKAPSSISFLTSRPTEKKKRDMRPSLTQPRSVRACAPMGGPSVFVQNASHAARVGPKLAMTTEAAAEVSSSALPSPASSTPPRRSSQEVSWVGSGLSGTVSSFRTFCSCLTSWCRRSVTRPVRLLLSLPLNARREPKKLKGPGLSGSQVRPARSAAEVARPSCESLVRSPNPLGGGWLPEPMANRRPLELRPPAPAVAARSVMTAPCHQQRARRCVRARRGRKGRQLWWSSMVVARDVLGVLAETMLLRRRN
mmetsp:Transcript_60657/g.190070  ORF Transcript_60657/g.190070 Transcript_60657/m.190070 type:complete len:271 (+) Transcript_60657:881-1693(+)